MWQFEQEMERQQKTKRAMAKKLTSRSQLNRLLDPQNTTVSTKTFSRSARVLGKRLVLEIRKQRPFAAHQRRWLFADWVQARVRMKRSWAEVGWTEHVGSIKVQ